ncbi:MAG: SIS domain-containing protein, partial [Schumannella sp.]
MLRRLLAEAPAPELADAIRRRSPTHIQIVARGTSGHAALHAKYLSETLLGIPVVIVTPSVVTVLGGSPWRGDDVVIAVSQSGASPDLVACVESARSAGALTIAFVNAPGSALGSAAQVEVQLDAGPELAVAATKSYTASVLALTRLVVALAPTAPAWDWASIPSAVERLVTDSAWLPSALAALDGATSAVVLGRAYGYATAREAALKIMETCAVPTLAYSSAEFRHGPLAAVGRGTAVLATGGIDPALLDACRAAGA